MKTYTFAGSRSSTVEKAFLVRSLMFPCFCHDSLQFMYEVNYFKFVQKTLITNKCTTSFFINCNTLLHVSTLLDHLQRELWVVVTTRSRYTVVPARTALGAVRAGTTESSRLQKQRGTQSTAHSHSTI
jgi:hypothetical protein